MDQKLFKSTNATSTGIDIDRKVLKALLTRSDRPGLVFLLQWAICLLFSGYAVYATLGSAWVWLSMFVFGTIITVPNYSLSHETAHGTAFKATAPSHLYTCGTFGMHAAGRREGTWGRVPPHKRMCARPKRVDGCERGGVESVRSAGPRPVSTRSSGCGAAFMPGCGAHFLLLSFKRCRQTIICVIVSTVVFNVVNGRIALWETFKRNMGCKSIAWDA